jgi:hypothetical protein
MEREFSYGLSYPEREAIHNALAATTVKHITKGDGLFSPMSFDPARGSSLMLETVHLQPTLSTIQEVRDLANIAGPKVAYASREVLRCQPAFVGAVRRKLNEDRENIIFATAPHVNIADVAVWQSAWVEAIGGEDWQDRNGLAISRGITTIEVFGMPASEVITKEGHGFLSFPRTSTIGGLEIDKNLIDTNNRRMRDEVKDWMGVGLTHLLRPARPGKSFHTSWEGKTMDVRYGDNGKPESLKFGRISDGTIDLVKNGVLVPVTIWESDDEAMVVIGDMTEVKNRRDVYRVQNWQRETLAHILGISTSKISIEGE